MEKDPVARQTSSQTDRLLKGSGYYQQESMKPSIISNRGKSN